MPFLSSLDIVTPRANLPVTTDFVREHSRIDSDGVSDNYLNFLISSATDKIEAYLDRSLITQTVKYNLVRTTESNSWPLVPSPLNILPLGAEWALLSMRTNDIGLLRNPVQSVGNVTVGDWGESDTVLVLNTDYNVDLTVDPARIYILDGNQWGSRSHISITYTCGYGPDYTYIPSQIVHAILLLTCHYYENRGDSDAGIPEAIYNMCAPYRLWHFGVT